ncbi:hypothetical protein N9Q05_02060 [bacterium]|nr:hypothetical protein [bacterium]
MKKIERLKEVMAVQTTSYNTKLMNDYIVKYITQLGGCKVVKRDGNIYVTKGSSDVYPCVVAHTDTVHDIEKEMHVIELNGVLLSVNDKYERMGIGGDDKVGIFVALEVLRNTEVCKVAFFRDEEVGCVGSKVADMKFFNDVAFVLQCDRRGYDDFVNEIFYTKLYSEDFSNAIQGLLYKYGRVESDGGMTDVYQLAENGLDVCVANMSCGYYDPHTDNEYIKIKEVYDTLDFVQELVDDLGHRRWEMKQGDRDSTSHYDRYSGVYGRHGAGGYRAYGDESYSKGSYSQHLPNDWTWGDEDYDDKVNRGGYLVKDATCLSCNGKEQLSYDETIEKYFCFGCDDYVYDDEIDFDRGGEDDPLLEHIEENKKLMETKGKVQSAFDDDGMPF